MLVPTYTRFLVLTSLLSVGLATELPAKAANQAIVNHNDLNDVTLQIVPQQAHRDGHSHSRQSQEVASAHDHVAADSKVKREWINFVERALGPTTPHEMIDYHLNQNRDTLDEAIRLDLSAGNHDPSTHAHHELKAQSAEALRQSREHSDKARDIARVSGSNRPAFQPHRREWVDIHERARRPVTPFHMVESHLQKQSHARDKAHDHNVKALNYGVGTNNHAKELIKAQKYTQEAESHYNTAYGIARANGITHLWPQVF